MSRTGFGLVPTLARVFHFMQAVMLDTTKGPGSRERDEDLSDQRPSVSTIVE